MDIELVYEVTPPEETPPELRYVRRIFSCKLLLSAVVIPIAIAAIIEVPHLYDDAASRFQATPILATLFFGSFYLAVALFFLAAFAAYIPIFGGLCFAPLLSILWQLTMLTIGLLVDTIFITPRVFVGSAIDALVLPQSADRSHLLYSNKTTNVLFLLLFLPFAAVTYLLWHPFYSDYLARSQREYGWSHYLNLTAEETRQWKEFEEKIRFAENAPSREAAIAALTDLNYRVGYMPFHDERHRRDAASEVSWAIEYLDSHRFDNSYRLAQRI